MASREASVELRPDNPESLVLVDGKLVPNTPKIQQQRRAVFLAAIRSFSNNGTAHDEIIKTTYDLDDSDEIPPLNKEELSYCPSGVDEN